MQYHQDKTTKTVPWQSAADLLPDAMDVLETMLNDCIINCVPLPFNADETWRWIVEEHDAYRNILVFSDVEIHGEMDSIYWNCVRLSKVGQRYLLEIAAVYEDGMEKSICVHFSGIVVETIFFNYTQSVVYGQNCPWDMVQRWFGALQGKVEACGMEALNSQEKCLLLQAKQEQGSKGFQNAKHETQWRRQYNELQAAAREYPIKNADKMNADFLYQKRNKVEAEMWAQEFQGQYPDFYCRSKLHGVHLRNGHGTDYFAGFGRVMDSYVHCVEWYGWGGQLYIGYVVGTVFPRKDEMETGKQRDAFSGFFHDGGRRFSGCLPPTASILQEAPGIQDNTELAQLAAKTARLQKLSKNEWCKMGRKNTVGPLKFIVFMLVCSMAFALIMTGGMVLVTSLVGLVITMSAGEPISQIVELLAALPWLPLFLWFAIGGGAIAAVSAVSCFRSLNE